MRWLKLPGSARRKDRGSTKAESSAVCPASSGEMEKLSGFFSTARFGEESTGIVPSVAAEEDDVENAEEAGELSPQSKNPNSVCTAWRKIIGFYLLLLSGKATSPTFFSTSAPLLLSMRPRELSGLCPPGFTALSPLLWGKSKRLQHDLRQLLSIVWREVLGMLLHTSRPGGISGTMAGTPTASASREGKPKPP